VDGENEKHNLNAETIYTVVQKIKSGPSTIMFQSGLAVNPRLDLITALSCNCCVSDVTSW